MGWATSAVMPEQFRLHWITIEEPDKASRAPGSIFFWVSELDAAGLVASEPRAHRLPWDEATAQAAEEALDALTEGEPLDGFISRGAVTAEEDPTGQGERAGRSANLSGDDGPQPASSSAACRRRPCRPNRTLPHVKPVVPGGGIQGDGQAVDQHVDLFAADDQRRGADYGVAHLPNHQAIADGGVAAVDGGAVVGVDALPAGLVAHQFQGAEQALVRASPTMGWSMSAPQRLRQWWAVSCSTFSTMAVSR